jgi:hypothetical protein
MQMEELPAEKCTYESRQYPHESEICDSGRCMQCNDGAWEDMDEWACCPI